MATILKNKPSILLIVLLSCLFRNANCSSSSLDSKLSAIKDICKSRHYPELCYDSLKLSISSGIDPSILESILYTLDDALPEAEKLSGILSAGKPDMVEIQQGAMQDCIELHDITMSLLRRSIFDSEHDRSPINLADHMTYLSTALTNKETCLEGLESASGPSKQDILSSIAATYDHVSIALSMFSQTQKSGKSGEKIHRRLIGYPTWISRKDRRILEGSVDEIDGGAIVFTVAVDGSGNFTRITDAINLAPNNSIHRTIIRIKKGTYFENVDIPGSKTNIFLIGEGKSATIITGNRSFDDHLTTHRTATLGVEGEKFMARDLTIKNTAGPQKHQAVALRVNGDAAALYRCNIEGFQDTLYVHSGRQFYRECDIYGTVDYIFGNAQAVIQASNIISRLPMPKQFITITAQSRNIRIETTGISIHNCSIIPAMDLKSASWKVESYLGRPWRKYATTVIMESYIDGFISPEGWTPWSRDENKNDGLKTVYYGEYKNRGLGSNIEDRGKWPGFHAMDHNEASRFSVSEFIRANEWLDSTIIPYEKGVS